MCPDVRVGEVVCLDDGAAGRVRARGERGHSSRGVVAGEGLILIYVLFFFSSRRRHTRSLRDWSSDVSSDLFPVSWQKISRFMKTERNSRSRILELPISRLPLCCCSTPVRRHRTKSKRSARLLKLLSTS